MSADLIVGDFLQTVGGDIGGGQSRLQALDMEHHTVLAVDAGHAAHDALEGAKGDANKVAGDEAALRHVHLHDMLVVQRCSTYQRYHVALVDSQRRVLALCVDLEVVVVEGDEARRLDITLRLVLRDVGKHQVQKRHQHPPALAVLAQVLPYHG